MTVAKLNINHHRIAKRIFSKVEKYIELRELKYILNSSSGINQSALQEINQLQKFILRDYPEIKSDSLALAIILYEMFCRTIRLVREKKIIRLGKQVMQGAERVSHVIQLYEQQPLNIEKISFTVRSRKPITDDRSTTETLMIASTVVSCHPVLE